MAKRTAKSKSNPVSEKQGSKKTDAQPSTEKKDAQRNPGSLSRFWEFFIPGVGFGGTFILCSVLFLGFLFWLNKTFFLADNSESWQVEYNLPQGVWAGEDILKSVHKSNPALFDRPYDDSKLLEDVANSFNLLQIVKKVKSVQRKYPNAVILDLEYFEPVAMVYVNSASGYYPVDKDGCRLPTKFFKESDIEKYLVISGIKSLPMNPVGQRWNDVGVDMASKTAAELVPYKNELGIAGIHVHESSEIENESGYTPTCIDIWLKNNTFIRWSKYISKPPGVQLVDDELSTEEKIDILRKCLKEKGEIKPDKEGDMFKFTTPSEPESESESDSESEPESE